MIVEKIKNKRIKAIIISLNLLAFTLIGVNLSIFYYKYSSVTSKDNSSYIEKATFIIDIYINEFEKLNKNERRFKEFLQSKGVGEIYLLRYDTKNNPQLIASSREQVEHDEVFLKGECKGVLNHNFKDPFFKKYVLAENRVNVCMFKEYSNYIIGIKHSFIQTLSGTHDPDFREWIMKNMMPTFVISIFFGIIATVIILWIINRYSELKGEFLNGKIKLKKSLKDIKNQLYVDPLTRLYNKSALMNDLKTLNKPKVIVIDIDDFGTMNDYYGKETCDKVLIYIATLIKDFAKNENMKAYCVGADQFALVENGDFFIDRYEDLANDLIGKFKGRIINIKDKENDRILDIEVHTTIGFSLDEEDTLMKATTALKMAKKLEKDFVCYFKGLNKKEEYATQIERSNLIKNAIINNNIIPFFQPIFDINGNITKYESLIRIIDSNEIVSPHAFLDIAKRIKRYAELQKMVINSCIEKLLEYPNLILSINLSGRDMLDGDVSVTILKLLNQHQVADRIVFELVEDENLENVERVENFIDKVKKMGAKIAIDDFGSGYSNFSYILKLKPDYIKIDGSIIKNIDVNQDSFMITRAIVSFAKDLGIRTIAEYIHSKDILQICKQLGVDEFQGFYLGMPTDKVD